MKFSFSLRHISWLITGLLMQLLTPSIAIAKATGLGEIAEDMMEPVQIISDLVGTGSMVVGICALLGAFLRYMQHRKNPMIAPMSTIIVMVLVGLALLGLPFIYKLAYTGVPYHIF